MLLCGVLVICLLVDSCVATSYADISNVTLRLNRGLTVLHGPVASHVSPGSVDVWFSRLGFVGSIAIMTEEQLTKGIVLFSFVFFFFFFFFFFFLQKANRSSCWVPAVARSDSLTFKPRLTFGVYYIVAIVCSPTPSSTITFSATFNEVSYEAQPSTSQLSRQQLWLSGLFVVLAGLLCFAFYSFPRGWDQRFFWSPFLLVIGGYLVLSAAEILVHWDGEFVLLSPIRWMRLFRGIWRVGSSLYFGWLCGGSILLGAKANLAVWLRWGVMCLGSEKSSFFSSFLMILAGACIGIPIFFSAIGSESMVYALGCLAWGTVFWGYCFWVSRLHLRINKLTLDGIRAPNALSPHDELLKRFAMRLLRGASFVGLFVSMFAAAIAVAGCDVTASAQLCDAVLLAAFYAVFLGMVLNSNSPNFLSMGSPSEFRRRAMGAIAGVVNGFRERALARQALVCQKKR
jgi:hypothetical protein